MQDPDQYSRAVVRIFYSRDFKKKRRASPNVTVTSLKISKAPKLRNKSLCVNVTIVHDLPCWSSGSVWIERFE